MAEDTAPKRKAKTPQTRDERLKAALKANMARRKAQARARADTGNSPKGQDKDDG